MSKRIRDFSFSRAGVTDKETGKLTPYNEAPFGDFFTWFPYVVCEKLRNNVKFFGKTPAFTVSFTPETAAPWYLIRSVISRAGGKRVSPDTPADLAFHFDDRTQTEPPFRPQATRHYNYDCPDISKSRVARIFEDVFGYGLAVDPTTYRGKMVAKSEYNGAHDGYVVTGPCDAEPGMVYQKLINNETDRNTVQDLRCPTTEGHIALVYIKERPLSNRFANSNATCRLSTPEAHFSDAERTDISRFCHAMGLDWGGIDVLRNKDDGRIYIVDVNKTDMGPPLALPLKDKLASTTILAKALKEALGH